MEITITLSEQDQLLQAEILKVLLKGEGKSDESDKSDKSDKPDETPKPAEQPTTQPAQKPTDQPAPKPYPTAGGEATPAPSDSSDTSDTSDTSDSSDSSDPSDPSDKAAHPSDKAAHPSDKPAPAPEAPALSMADLRKSVNAISRKKGLNWLYSWLGDLGVKSIADIPVARLEEAHTKLQNYA